MDTLILHRTTADVDSNESPKHMLISANSEHQNAELDAVDGWINLADVPWGLLPEVDWPGINFDQIPLAHLSEQASEKHCEHVSDAISEFYRDGVKGVVLNGWRFLPGIAYLGTQAASLSMQSEVSLC